MTIESRKVWTEAAALCLFLLGLGFLLVAGYYAAVLVLVDELPPEVPIAIHGMAVGPREILVSVLSMLLPGAALVAAAWWSRSLLADVREEGE